MLLVRLFLSYLTGLKESLLAECIRTDFDLAETIITEHGDSIDGIKRVELEVKTAFCCQIFYGIMGNGPVKKQRVVIGYEEGSFWFVVKHIASHRCTLTMADIRWVADNRVDTRRLRVENVTVLKGYISTKGSGISTGNAEGRIRDIPGSDMGLRDTECQCNGNAAAASTDIQDRARNIIGGISYHPLT